MRWSRIFVIFRPCSYYDNSNSFCHDILLQTQYLHSMFIKGRAVKSRQIEFIIATIQSIVNVN